VILWALLRELQLLRERLKTGSSKMNDASPAIDEYHVTTRAIYHPTTICRLVLQNGEPMEIGACMS
jgi:hypothetical protein